MGDERAGGIPAWSEPDATSRLGRYEVDELIGVGETGEVWKARRWGAPELGKPVVVKRLHAPSPPPVVSDARLWAWLGHPNLVQVHELGAAEGRPFLAMEYLDGMSLRSLLAELATRKQPFPVPVAVYL